MKIRRVNIASFGQINGFFADFSEKNMNVVYGDNEAGKTTISEFIRTTLFPGKPSKYPAPRKSDTGMIEVEMENGEIKVLEREYKTVKEKYGRTTPAEEVHMDHETYRSISSLDLEFLGNSKIISSGEYRKKFLTVPGGEHIPAVSKSIDSRMDELLNKERISDRKIIGKHLKNIKSIDEELNATKENLHKYDALALEKSKIIESLSDAKELQNQAKIEGGRMMVMDALRGQIDTLDRLKKERENLSYADELSEEDITLYETLSSNLRVYDGLLDDSEDTVDGFMSASEAREYMNIADKIEAIWEKRNRVDTLHGAMTDLSAAINDIEGKIDIILEKANLTEDQASSIIVDDELKERLSRPREGRQMPQIVEKFMDFRMRIPVIAIGALLIVSFMILHNPIPPIVGGILIALSLIYPKVISSIFDKKDVDLDIMLITKGFSAGLPKDDVIRKMHAIEKIDELLARRADAEERLARATEEYVDLKEEISETTLLFGIDTGSLRIDINDLYSQYIAAKNVMDAFNETDGISEKRFSTEKKLEELFAKYGSESNFKKLMADKDLLKKLDLKIESVEESIEVDVEVSVAQENAVPVKDDSIDPDSIVDDLNVRLGEITANMDAIINDNTVGELMYTKESETQKIREYAKEWAMLSLSDTIIAECCAKFYSDLQPTVVRTANRYLELMTDGRYRLSNDPRVSEISIEDRKGVKIAGEWSSGLADQVYLAVKMAIAKELGSEKLPFIIDDVLVRFDARRKQGACRALAEFAMDQQTIIFTCDSTVLSMFKMMDDVRIITL